MKKSNLTRADIIKILDDTLRDMPQIIKQIKPTPTEGELILDLLEKGLGYERP